MDIKIESLNDLKKLLAGKFKLVTPKEIPKTINQEKLVISGLMKMEMNGNKEMDIK